MVPNEMDGMEAICTYPSGLPSLINDILSNIDLQGIRTVYGELNKPAAPTALATPSPTPIP
jgi:hypothetical protein